MSGFLKIVGLIACLYSVYYVFSNFNEQTQEYTIYFFGTIGVMTSLYLLFRLIFGKKWKSTLFKKTVVGEDLVETIQDTLEEFPNVQKNTWAKLGGNLIYRFTRIGIVALLIAMIPIILLFQQNLKIDHQNELITDQTARLEEQTYLQEADRRSSLVFLFSNIMDAMDKELKEANDNKSQRILSDQLIGRIVALSHMLKPYHYLEEGFITKKPLSPERGALLLNLVHSKIELKSLSKIFDEGDFTYSDLRGRTLRRCNLSRLNLRNSNLENTTFHLDTFYSSSFINANMKNAFFVHSRIKNSRFQFSNLSSCHFSHCNMVGNNFNGAILKDAKFFRITMNPYNGRHIMDSLKQIQDNVLKKNVFNQSLDSIKIDSGFLNKMIFATNIDTLSMRFNWKRHDGYTSYKYIGTDSSSIANNYIMDSIGRELFYLTRK